MGFWSFLRDMFVLDWLFGKHKKESFGERSQGENNRHTDCHHNDNHHSGGYSDYDGYSGYGGDDYARQDFDDDLDAGMFDDDF